MFQNGRNNEKFLLLAFVLQTIAPSPFDNAIAMISEDPTKEPKSILGTQIN